MQEDCNCQQQNDSGSQRKQQICIGKSCHYISYEAAHCHQKCVWHLSRYMRNVVASCTGGGQNGGIGDRRTVIAKYRACRVADRETISSSGAALAQISTTIGMRIPKVPHAVPVEKERNAATAK